MVAAFNLIGREDGKYYRVEDFCNAASVARGTFYNYFNSIADLYSILADELSADFNDAVHEVIDQPLSAATRTALAIRYHIKAAMDNPSWGWAIVHTSLGSEVLGPVVSMQAKQTIVEGIAAGEFSIRDAELGKALLLGAALGNTLDVLHGRATPDCPERLAQSILLALGVSSEDAAAIVGQPLPELRPRNDSASASPVNFWAVLPASKSD
ncbi:hypothetical protein RLDS_16845 [Sphingobium lactosutens DS20]|uniref:Tetracyclin repressor-like 40 C-terminal domain-containing protein n=1 Tax=Sphingobium lactosutens DS20 TaxID=1331060 RepID=T0HAQ9_9SPHN|nr:hypothetical protein RLDS_16845 [Sphingobium lactosutens DS20]